MGKRSKQVIGCIGIFAFAYVIFSIVSQAPADRTPAIVLSVIVIVVCLCIIGYTMMVGRRNRRQLEDKAKK